MFGSSSIVFAISFHPKYVCMNVRVYVCRYVYIDRYRYRYRYVCKPREIQLTSHSANQPTSQPPTQPTIYRV